MGNSSSSSGRVHHDESVDYGHLIPQGVYTGPRDWNQAIVTQLICARRLAPFYRPLEDYDESWDDDQILANRKELQVPDPDGNETGTRIEAPLQSHTPKANHNKRPGALKDPSKPEAARSHLTQPINGGRRVLEPTAPRSSPQVSSMYLSRPSHIEDLMYFYSPDQIRPDWEAKLAAVRAAVTRRANRRIIMRQVGDRLIPVGVTSGRVHALSPEEAQAEGVDGGGSRRARRRQQAAQGQNFEQFMGMAGQDLEELMLMEAMRLSMIDHEEHQRKEAEEKKKQEAAATAGLLDVDSASANAVAGPSTLEPPTGHLISLSPSPASSSPISSSPVPVSQVRPRDSFTSKRNSLLASLSRSRTPPLTNSPPRNGESSLTPWHRSPSPAPYSTLTAAMSAASTASAVLGNSPAASVTGLVGETSSSLSIPNTNHDDDISPLPSPLSEQTEASSLTSSPARNWAPSEVAHSSSPYDTLSSSAESLVAYEPLSGSRTHEEI
ncbi:hypothetical protein H0H81_012009 [Sphagnurus paluster]|uniref:Uncharacterized protein n=1 Tax=Sphagnurus paluster TaxID=117069 RepID=A0A9P7K3J8_9AGAR|nr:hypothetical protein H0H81_012009 [Sphagnurus paluster]